MRQALRNKGYSEDDIKFTEWPLIYTDDWEFNILEKFNTRKTAVELFLGTETSINEITNLTGIRKNEIYRFVARCLSRDNNNNLLGYKGLIPNIKIENYKRKIQNNQNTETSNYSGSFTLLLKEYPTLKEFLIEEYFKSSTKKSSAREVKISFKNIHRKFISECRKCGIKPSDYPFNTTSLASNSVYRFLKNISNSYYKEVAKMNGKQSEMLLRNTNNSDNSNTSILRPLERVEFDGHRIDGIFIIEYTAPGGEQIIDTLKRIWILTLVDVATRCVIGYHVCLRQEYSSDDVKKCFQSAIIPWEPKKLTIPGLEYNPDANFPSRKFDDAKYAIWDELCFDNAKSHLSNEIQDILRKHLKCSINMGPVAVPVRRPIIERFFRKLEEDTFHRLPSTTGSNTLDPKRDDPEKKAIKYRISYELVEELCDVYAANYNATPHDSNNGFTPLEIFESRLEQGYTLYQLPEQQRNKINLFPLIDVRTVKGNIAKGLRPYVVFKGVRYTNSELSADFSMVNEKFKLLINTEDLRTLEAFRDDGTSYGVLTASGQWGKVPHSLKFKNAMNKFKRKRYFHYTEFDDPMWKLQDFLETQAINDKSLRNLLAELKSYRKKYNSENIKAEEKKKKEFIQNNHLELQNIVIEHKKQTNSIKKKDIDEPDIQTLIIEQKIKEKNYVSTSENSKAEPSTNNFGAIQEANKDESDIQTLITEQKIKEKNCASTSENSKAEPSTNNVSTIQEANNYERKNDAHQDYDFKDLEHSYFDELIEDARKKRPKKRRSINI